MKDNEVPPIDEWLTVKQAAKMLGVSHGRVRDAYSKGRKNVSGNTVKLTVFRTMGGLVTTRRHIDEFHRLLNG